ncbi:MAG: HAD family phosphatase [Bacilli bacterium]|nr:HAD family phosphatase [Bacilli bacterium]
MKIVVSGFDGTLCINNQIMCPEKINKFVGEGNIFIIATGRNIAYLKRDIDKVNLNVSYFICNDGAMILDQFLNVIYRTDIDETMIRSLYNDLKNDSNVLEVLIDTGSGYTDDVQRSTNKLIARYYDKQRAINLVNNINSKYTNVFGYVSNNWINITKKTETKESAINYLADFYNLKRYPIYTIGNDINDISMADFQRYGLNDGNNQHLDKFDKIVNNFEEAFDDIVNEHAEEEYN